jgi:hypothetical protein
MALVACNRENHGQPGGPDAPPGAAARDNGYELGVLEIRTCPPPSGTAPPPGHIRLGVHVELSSTASEPIPVNTFYATIVDSLQRSYSATFAGCEPVLRNPPLRRGERARGFATFELPESASGLELVYAPRLSDGSAESSARVRLGR